MLCQWPFVTGVPLFSQERHGGACDVERTFSVWKRVRSDRQHDMKKGTHKANVSFYFSGTVPAP